MINCCIETALVAQKILLSVFSSSWFDGQATETSQQLVFALGHSLWQGAIVAILVAWMARWHSLSLDIRYWVCFDALLLIGIAPLMNFMVLNERPSPGVHTSLPLQAISTNVDGTGEKIDDGASSVRSSAGVRERLESSFGQASVFVFPLITAFYVLGVATMTWRLRCGLVDQRLIRMLSLTHVNHTDFARLRARVDETAKRMGLAGIVSIGLVEGPISAVIVGCWKPIVLVNLAILTGMTPQQLDQIVAHELSHLKRWDPLMLLIQRVIEAFHFFNPSVWFVSHIVSELREQCCDRQVIRFHDPVEYALTLVECARVENRVRHAMSLAATGTSDLLFRRRIGILLNLQMPPRTVTKDQTCRWYRIITMKPWLIVVVLFVGICGSLWALSPQESQTARPVPQWPWVMSDQAKLDDVSMAFNSKRLGLTSTVPGDLRIQAMVNPVDCRFAQWQFGDHRSTRVALAIEFIDGQPARVFLDANRDRVLNDAEELAASQGSPASWVAKLPVEIRDGNNTLRADREIAIVLTRGQTAIRVATLGHATGKIELNYRSYQCKRVDQDGDGIPMGGRDEIWIDLNADDSFDLLSERFRIGPQVSINGATWRVHSDAFGQELKLTQSTQFGSVAFSVALADPRSSIVQLQGVLRDRQGMFVPIRIDQKVELAPGEYCIESLVATVVDQEQVQWHLTMSRATDTGWIYIRDSETHVVELLSSPQLLAQAEQITGPYGERESGFSPHYVNSHGLRITELSKGRDVNSGNREPIPARFRLSRADGHSVPISQSEHCSGFGCGRLMSVSIGDELEIDGSWTIAGTIETGPFFGRITDTTEVHFSHGR